MSKLKPIHPGEILREEFVAPFGLNSNKLALALRVPPPTVYEIVKEERGISPEMALRLARYFGTTPEFWMNLQVHYDLSISRRDAEEKIKRDIRPLAEVK
jgi:addiction module HigA family antidote